MIYLLYIPVGIIAVQSSVPIEIHGTKGSLSVPDPHGFGGTVQINTGSGWEDVPLTHGFAENSRALGVADMAYGILNNTPHRASGELAYHVLDAMWAFLDASEQSKAVFLESTVERPAAMPENWLAKLQVITESTGAKARVS